MSRIKWDVRTTIPKLSCLRLNLFTENNEGLFHVSQSASARTWWWWYTSNFFFQIEIGIYLIRPFYGSKEYIHADHYINDNNEDGGVMVMAMRGKNATTNYHFN